MMVSTRNTINNDQITEEQITMFQIIQRQTEDMRQKGIEDRHKNEEEVCLLKEQNEELKRRLDIFE